MTSRIPDRWITKQGGRVKISVENSLQEVNNSLSGVNANIGILSATISSLPPYLGEETSSICVCESKSSHACARSLILSVCLQLWISFSAKQLSQGTCLLQYLWPSSAVTALITSTAVAGNVAALVLVDCEKKSRLKYCQNHPDVQAFNLTVSLTGALC